MSEALLGLAEAHGIARSYHDTTGAEHHTSPETARALLVAMGVNPQASALDAPILPPWIVAEPGAVRLPLGAGERWVICCEDGTQREGTGPDGPDLPLGRHRLDALGGTCWLLIAPARLPLPARGWGVTLPLYGLRDAEQGGMGCYADLARVAQALGQAGAGFIGLNPVHAGLPGDPNAYSPYQPSHRRRLNTAHIALPDLPGTGGALIDYATDLPAQQAALRAAYAKQGDAPAFEAWRQAEGAPLDRFATYQALAERHGPTWDRWPEALQTPQGAAEAVPEAELRFHAWAQFAAEEQLAQAATVARDAGMAQGLYLDLAVGVHPHGAETWEDRAAFAIGVSLGAPPDAFSPDGQTWGLAPLNPRHLIATGFAPLAETLRAQLRHAGMLRIDHVLGFERAFWVPLDGNPGAYVAMPRDAMLAVARMEAARAGAVIVGEDLGNVPDGLRAALDTSGLLGCRVAMFERDWHGHYAPEHYDTASLTSFSTHDLPTWAGWRQGLDLETRAAIAGHPVEDAARADRGKAVAEFDLVAGTASGAAEDLHAFIARTNAQLVAIQAEDMLGIAEQPNLPGTTTEHPNWRRRLPIGPDAWQGNGALMTTAALMRDAGRSGGT